MTNKTRCVCEACKAERAARLEARDDRRTRKVFQAAVTAVGDYERVNERALTLGREALKMIDRHQFAEWTCGDGRRVKVREMENAHLFYAIAKGMRNEYPCSLSRKTGIEALRAEAVRRILGHWVEKPREEFHVG
jgi:hypothetical protein